MEPTDLIMADRGFTIKEDLIVQGATLEIPPPSSGLEQMNREKVKTAKKDCQCKDTCRVGYWSYEGILYS